VGLGNPEIPAIEIAQLAWKVQESRFGKFQNPARKISEFSSENFRIKLIKSPCRSR
jgi:hypothetical protein